MRDLGLSYEDAAHGVQSAIKFELEHDHRIPGSTESIKHLRTGIDCRAADAQGLAALLIAKGVFTEEEYLEYVRIAMNEELARYTDHVRERFELPKNVTFR